MTERSGSATRANVLPLTTSEDFQALRTEWLELHAATPEASIFSHPDWVATWLRHFGEPCLPVFLAVRREEELIGVIPLDMDPGAMALLGNHNLSDYSPILAAPGAEALAARGLLEWLNEDMAPFASLWGLPESSPFATAVRELAGQFGRDATTEDEALTPTADLPASFDDFLAGLSKKDRHELRRKMRLAESAGELRFEEYTDPGDIAERLDRFLELMRASRTDKAEFLNGHTEAFFRDIAAMASAAGLMRLSTITIDGNLAAMTWSFETAETTLLYNSGYAPEYAAISIGIVSKALALRSAIERGKRRFNFLRGDEDYKFRMGAKARRLLRIQLRHR